jgi:hypothetical protein
MVIKRKQVAELTFDNLPSVLRLKQDRTTAAY